MNLSATLRRVSLSGAVAAGALALGLGTASAAPLELPQPSIAGVDLAGALPGVAAENGKAAASAEKDAIALGVSANGGRAVADASNLSGPAAIAVGKGAHAHAHGVAPGLALAVAGPDSTVKVSGTEAAQCSGNLGLAGDFQTLTGCVALPTLHGPVAIPLNAAWLLGR